MRLKTKGWHQEMNSVETLFERIDIQTTTCTYKETFREQAGRRKGKCQIADVCLVCTSQWSLGSLIQTV